MTEQEKTTKVVQSYDQPIQIDLSRGAKGQYYWKISVKAESPLSALHMVQDIDQELRHRYALAPDFKPGTPKLQAPSPEDPHTRMEKAIAGAKEAGEKGPFRSG